MAHPAVPLDDDGHRGVTNDAEGPAVVYDDGVVEAGGGGVGEDDVVVVEAGGVVVVDAGVGFDDDDEAGGVGRRARGGGGGRLAEDAEAGETHGPSGAGEAREDEQRGREADGRFHAEGKRDDYANEDPCKVFVGGLSWNVDDQALGEAFEVIGTVTEARVLFDHETQKSKGYGFVTFDSRAAVERAIERMSGTMLENRQIAVRRATRGPQGGRSPGYERHQHQPRQAAHGLRSTLSGGVSKPPHGSPARPPRAGGGAAASPQRPRIRLDNLPSNCDWCALKDFIGEVAVKPQYTNVFQDKRTGGLSGVADFHCDADMREALGKLDGVRFEDQVLSAMVEKQQGMRDGSWSEQPQHREPAQQQWGGNGQQRRSNFGDPSRHYGRRDVEMDLRYDGYGQSTGAPGSRRGDRYPYDDRAGEAFDDRRGALPPQRYVEHAGQEYGGRPQYVEQRRQYVEDPRASSRLAGYPYEPMERQPMPQGRPALAPAGYAPPPRRAMPHYEYDEVPYARPHDETPYERQPPPPGVEYGGAYGGGAPAARIPHGRPAVPYDGRSRDNYGDYAAGANPGYAQHPRRALPPHASEYHEMHEAYGGGRGGGYAARR